MRKWWIALAVGAALPATAAAPGTGAPHPPQAAARVPIVLLVDLSSGQELYARQGDRRFLPASTTKAMSALVAFDLIKAGKITE